MSTKINALLPFVIATMAANSVAASVSASPVVEALLNDLPVGDVYVTQVDDSGRAVMFVNLGDAENPSLRPVATAQGDLKLFAGLAAAASTVKRMLLQPGAIVSYYRKEKSGQLGDPLVALKRSYKAFKAEKLQGEASAAMLQTKITAARSLGWDTQTATLEAFEYADYIKRQETIGEWVAYTSNRVTALAASLTAAGVDPMTVV